MCKKDAASAEKVSREEEVPGTRARKMLSYNPRRAGEAWSEGQRPEQSKRTADVRRIECLAVLTHSSLAHQSRGTSVSVGSSGCQLWSQSTLIRHPYRGRNGQILTARSLPMLGRSLAASSVRPNRVLRWSRALSGSGMIGIANVVMAHWVRASHEGPAEPLQGETHRHYRTSSGGCPGGTYGRRAVCDG